MRMEMIEQLSHDGFTLWSIQRGFTDSENGQTLQIDAIFYQDSSFS